MNTEEYRKVDPWDIIFPVLVVLLAGSLPRIIGDAWIVSIIAFFAGILSLALLAKVVVSLLMDFPKLI